MSVKAAREPPLKAMHDRPHSSIRRECLDHHLVLGETHSRRVLTEYAGYYKTARTHLAIGEYTPLGRP